MFRVLILLCLPLPAPFHSPVPKCTPRLLSSSSFLHSLNLFSAPALMGPRFPPLTPFYPHSLPYPPPALLYPQMPASPRTPAAASTLCPASAPLSQANHAEMQCNCANVSYPSLPPSSIPAATPPPRLSAAHSTLRRARRSASGERLLRCEKCLRRFINETFRFKFRKINVSSRARIVTIRTQPHISACC